jgi:hypothetical protein
MVVNIAIVIRFIEQVTYLELEKPTTVKNLVLLGLTGKVTLLAKTSTG